MGSRLFGLRSIVAAAATFAVVASGASAFVAPSSVDAATCVKFVAARFDAPGDDNYNLNAEWVRIKNTCSSAISIAGWTIRDTPAYHVYRFKSGVSIGAGVSITLYSGSGADTATKKYWRQSYSAVWNNDGDTAVLKNSAGKTQSRWVGP